MKRKIICAIKIYLITIVYTICIAFIYSFYISHNMVNTSPIIELIIGGSSYFILGMLMANAIHKKGLIVGLLTGIITILFIHLVYLLSKGEFNFKLLPCLIYTILCGIGGILGVNFKKII